MNCMPTHHFRWASLAIRRCRRMAVGWLTATWRMGCGICGCAISGPVRPVVSQMCRAIKYSRHGRTTRRQCSTARTAAAAYGLRRWRAGELFRDGSSGGLIMNLERLKSNWESLAERDALFAILTDHRRVDGKWEIAEFMARGEAEIETVMHHLDCIGCTPNYSGKALDFGCGVGRVTQALAPRFTSCVGVDISRQMIDKARSLNRY